MIEAITLLFSFLPSAVQVMILAILAIFLIIIVFRVIAMVLDAIPFL